MALEAQLQALLVPFGTEFPGTVQGLLDLIAQYEEITGLEDFNGINFGPTEPTEDDRDRPWFKTDEDGNPVGWYAWNGLIWAAIPIVLPTGASGDRPSAPAEGTQYFDTTINTALIYLGGGWVTLTGSPGDVKEVRATSLAVALTNNPGWAHDTDSIGKVIAGSAADGSDNQTSAGADEITLTEDQLPAHIHEDLEVTGSEADNGDNGGYTIMAASQSLGLKTVTNSRTGSTGGGDPIDNRQSTFYYFRIYKL